MAQIKLGTVTVTNGSATVTGAGTKWVTDGVQAGDGFVLQTDVAINGSGIYYQVGGSITETSLALTAPWAGDTAVGALYVVIPDFIAPGYPALLPGDLEVKSVFNRNVSKLVSDKQDGNVTTSTGFQSVADALDSRVNIGEIGPEPLSTSTGLQTLIDALNDRLIAQAPGDIAGAAALRGAIGAGDLYSRGGILGTVSQSGGVPTGAIIQRGSNANGEFVRWADGTQIATFYSNFGLSIGANSVVGFSWNLPIAFVDSNYYAASTGTPSLSNDVFSNVYTDSYTNNSVVFFFRNGATAQNIENRRYFAIGRWY